jgi:hypothetical protein
MNPLNYPTLPACQRLVAAGIVLETDMVWRVPQWTIGNKEPIPELMSKYKADAYHQYDKDNNHIFAMIYPAPSPAEVWRELPKQENSVRFGAYLEVSKTIDFAGTEVTYAGYLRDGIASADYTNTNPADALIYLLIWVTEQGKEKE